MKMVNMNMCSTGERESFCDEREGKSAVVRVRGRGYFGSSVTNPIDLISIRFSCYCFCSIFIICESM
jgi:hypothetical protein